MPLPTKKTSKDFKDCVSKAISIEKSAHPNMDRKQLVAIALSHCRKVYGMENEINELKQKIEKELEELKIQSEELAVAKKWIQKAVSPKTEGDFEAWCKRQGFKGVCQECINKAAKVGGRAAKMALFAVNVSKGKYTYPKKKK